MGAVAGQGKEMVFGKSKRGCIVIVDGGVRFNQKVIIQSVRPGLKKHVSNRALGRSHLHKPHLHLEDEREGHLFVFSEPRG